MSSSRVAARSFSEQEAEDKRRTYVTVEGLWARTLSEPFDSVFINRLYSKLIPIATEFISFFGLRAATRASAAERTVL